MSLCRKEATYYPTCLYRSALVSRENIARIAVYLVALPKSCLDATMGDNRDGYRVTLTVNFNLAGDIVEVSFNLDTS